MKIGDRIYVRGYIDEIRKDTVIVRNNGGYFGTTWNEVTPSAQPEIIHCRDCKHHSYDAGYGRDWCNRMSGVFRVKPDDYCSRAERRTDETD